MPRSSTAWAVAAPAPAAADMGDIFGDIFGNIFGGGGGGARAARRGADVGYVMELDLEEAVAGVEKRIEIPTLAACEPCHGSGSEDGKAETCSTCGGRGQVRMQRGIFAMQQACPHCGGRGQIIRNPCKTCHGAGRVEEEKVLSVKIPAGVDNGDRIRLAGEGEAGPAGTPPGDLYVEVRVREHDIFQRDGDDLHCEVPIRISQAALGDTVRVPTLEGEAEIRIPAETQTGKLFRLRGKGVKSVRSRSTGDLFCRVAVETPVNLTQRTARTDGEVRGDLHRRGRAQAFAQVGDLPGRRQVVLGPDDVLRRNRNNVLDQARRPRSRRVFLCVEPSLLVGSGERAAEQVRLYSMAVHKSKVADARRSLSPACPWAS